MSVVHILKDGTRLNDITGHVVRLEDAESLYRFLDSLNQNNLNKSRIHNSNKCFRRKLNNE